MTARRDARRAQLATPGPGLVGVPLLLELADPDHPLWHNRARYRAYMASHRWPMPARERICSDASPANRRSAAAAGWALDNGLGRDWHKLRSWGLTS